MGLTPLARFVAVRVGVIDHPIGNKLHKTPTPLLGGVAVYFAFAIAVLLALPLSPPVIGLLVGGLTCIVVGVLDEIISLPPLWHLFGQTAAAVVGVISGIGVVRNLSNPFASLITPGLLLPAAVGALLTVFWLVGMMNTVNFLDGLDGLATGVAALTAILLAVWASEPSRYYLLESAHHRDLVLPAALGGALLGFLPFNWHRASIFLGDSGALFLGFALGAMAIIGPAKLGTALLVLVVPVLDVAWAIVRRFFRRRSFLSGDKQHVYHRMMELGLTDTRTVLLLYLVCATVAVLDLYLFKLAKLVALLLLGTLAAVVFVTMEVKASRRGRRPGSMPGGGDQDVAIEDAGAR